MWHDEEVEGTTLSFGAAILLAYLAGVCLLAWVASRQIRDVDDFVLAGRSLGLRLSVSTMLATWVGAGTLIVAADETARVGASAVALEPLGAGLALLVASIFAARIWRLRVSTLPDVFRSLYGRRAEQVAAATLIPADLMWGAVQYLALGAIIQMYLGVPVWIALPMVACVGLLKTQLGGLKVIAWTDAVQVVLVILGMIVLSVVAVARLGEGSVVAGWVELVALPPERRNLLPPFGESLPWLGILLAGSLGNVSDQALVQRISAAKSPRVASVACGLAGSLYICIGAAPVLIGLSADQIIPGVGDSVIPALATTLMHPAVTAVFIVTMVAAVLSTIDSAMLAPSSVLAHNVGAGMLGLKETVTLHRICLFVVAAATLGLALCGVAPYRLLTLSYEICLVTLVVPMLFGLIRKKPAPEDVALASVGVGGGFWLFLMGLGLQTVPGTPVPVGMAAAGLAALTYIGGDAALRFIVRAAVRRTRDIRGS